MGRKLLGFQELSSSERVVESYKLVKYAARRLEERAANAIGRRRRHIAHFGVHNPRNNAGDTVLFDVIEKLFDAQFGTRSWVKCQLRSRVEQSDIPALNEAEAILVGGGGLLIADTARNVESGWQWRISREELEALSAPLIVFAIGYNQFRGGESFGDNFREHLNATVRKSKFFGLRNNGSLLRTRDLLEDDLKEKVVHQPCMTTVLSKYHPVVMNMPRKRPSKVVALNLAFDRADQRFGDKADLILSRVEKAVVKLLASGWKVDLTLHGWDDAPALEYFRKRDITVNPVFLNLCSSDEIVAYYNSVSLVVGMRGHAQMIPFGCGTPILSLISHDKMRFFLEDIEQPAWGIEIADEAIGDAIVHHANSVASRPSEYRSAIEAAKDDLWAVTMRNMDSIGL